MAKITRIKASDTKKSSETPVEAPKKAVKKKTPKDTKKTEKAVKTPEKGQKKPFLLFRPFVALGKYIKNSWLELRQVRWPSRKATWKLVFTVFLYVFILMAVIALLDVFFTFVFNKLIG